MKGFEEFQHAMFEAVQVYLRPLLDEKRDGFGEALLNRIFRLNGPTVVDRELTDTDRFLAKTFYGFREIQMSFSTLEDIAFYVGRFPFQKTRITPERYLQFHIEAWFAELYVLQGRLRGYLKAVERQHKKHPRLPEIRTRCKNLDDWISKTLKDAVQIRGQHIHEVRFSDDDVDRLGTIELLTHGSDDDISRSMHVHHRLEYRKVKKVWKDRLLANNKAIRKLLDIFCGALFPVVFDEKTEALKYPSYHKI